jgi:hypothetical protein
MAFVTVDMVEQRVQVNIPAFLDLVHSLVHQSVRYTVQGFTKEFMEKLIDIINTYHPPTPTSKLSLCTHRQLDRHKLPNRSSVILSARRRRRSSSTLGLLKLLPDSVKLILILQQLSLALLMRLIRRLKLTSRGNSFILGSTERVTSGSQVLPQRSGRLIGRLAGCLQRLNGVQRLNPSSVGLSGPIFSRYFLVVPPLQLLHLLLILPC